MTALPADGYFSDVSRTNAQAKQAQDDLLARTKTLPGGAARSELTIASGSVTPTGAVHSIDTESDASADDLATIDVTNMADGSLLVITAANAARVVTVKHGTGNITLIGAADAVLDSTDKYILLQRSGSGWVEVSLRASGDGSGLSGVLTQGKHAANFPAAIWRPQVTSGCSLLKSDESPTNDVMTEFREFSASIQQYAQVWFRAPKSSDEASTFSGWVGWKEKAGATSHVCRWTIEAQVQGDGDTVDSAWGTAVAVDDTGTAGTRREIAFSGVTPEGTWAEGDWIGLRISRDPSGDSLDVAAHFIGLQLDLTLNAGNDA